MKGRFIPALGVALSILLVAHPAFGLFHLAVIDEVLTSYDGDPQVQFVEIRMQTGLQRFVRNSVLGAFDDQGNYLGDVLVVPSDVSNDGIDVTWLMGTAAFETATGLVPDFIIPPNLPLGGGMICWGAPGVIVPAPAAWDHTNPELYVDCIAYGSYSGPTNAFIGNPNPLTPEGHSLVRIDETHDSADDFQCGDPADPTNNLSGSMSLPATSPCPLGLDAVIAAIFAETSPEGADLNGDDRVNAADLTAFVIALG